MTSTIPAVLDAIIAAWSTAPALTGVAIVDGQPVTGLEDDAIIVGYTEEETGVDSALADDLAGRMETYDVTCVVSVWHGDTAMAPMRTRAFEVLSAAADALATDPGVAAAAARTHVRARTVNQTQSRWGAKVDITFAVHVDAFVR